jgi:hypothetical protein
MRKRSILLLITAAVAGCGDAITSDTPASPASRPAYDGGSGGIGNGNRGGCVENCPDSTTVSPLSAPDSVVWLEP